MTPEGKILQVQTIQRKKFDRKEIGTIVPEEHTHEHHHTKGHTCSNPFHHHVELPKGKPKNAWDGFRQGIVKAALLTYMFSPAGCPGDDLWPIAMKAIAPIMHLSPSSQERPDTDTGVLLDLDWMKIELMRKGEPIDHLENNEQPREPLRKSVFRRRDEREERKKQKELPASEAKINKIFEQTTKNLTEKKEVFKESYAKHEKLIKKGAIAAAAIGGLSITAAIFGPEIIHYAQPMFADLLQHFHRADTNHIIHVTRRAVEHVSNYLGHIPAHTNQPIPQDISHTVTSGESVWSIAQEQLQQASPKLSGNALEQATNAYKNLLLNKNHLVGNHFLSLDQKVSMLSNQTLQKLADIATNNPHNPDFATLANPPGGIDAGSNETIVKAADIFTKAIA